jgi:hypothetical protein
MNRVIASEWLWRRSMGILATPAASVLAIELPAGSTDESRLRASEGRLERPAGGLTGEHAPGCSLGVPGIRTCSPVD